MERIEWEDVQRIVLSGCKHLPYSAYVLRRFQPEERARKKAWLADLAKRLTPALPDPDSKAQPAINLALTASGLQHLGIDEPALNSFSMEFLEGMAPPRTPGAPIPRRTNILGDLEASSPEFWDWGGWNKKTREIDVLLMLFATDETSLEKLIESEIEAMQGISDGDAIVLKGRLFYPEMKEHFGYVDGLSQPKIEGRPERKKQDPEKGTSEIKPGSEVKPGEFLLGYLNERRACVTDGHGHGHGRDVRRNGTYLVFRQLEQDVPAFNAFISNLAKNLDETEEWVAARLLGRSRNGDPLIAEGLDAGDSKNDFLYYYQDHSGLTCPIGAHIRRANPRDSLIPDPETALRLSKMHRIIRRGRPYGERWEPNIGEPVGENVGRGMLFIALNADIAGQFELIQHSWLNNPRFNGLYTGTDPISHFSGDESITIQNRPANLHIRRPAPFVRVRGGAYFFLPGIRALRDIGASA